MNKIIIDNCKFTIRKAEEIIRVLPGKLLFVFYLKSIAPQFASKLLNFGLITKVLLYEAKSNPARIKTCDKR